MKSYTSIFNGSNAYLLILKDINASCLISNEIQSSVSKMADFFFYILDITRENNLNVIISTDVK